jgi:hypothetical protein
VLRRGSRTLTKEVRDALSWLGRRPCRWGIQCVKELFELAQGALGFQQCMTRRETGLALESVAALRGAYFEEMGADQEGDPAEAEDDGPATLTDPAPEARAELGVEAALCRQPVRGRRARSAALAGSRRRGSGRGGAGRAAASPGL